jgi:hypothetical protein
MTSKHIKRANAIFYALLAQAAFVHGTAQAHTGDTSAAALKPDPAASGRRPPGAGPEHRRGGHSRCIASIKG